MPPKPTKPDFYLLTSLLSPYARSLPAPVAYPVKAGSKRSTTPKQSFEGTPQPSTLHLPPSTFNPQPSTFNLQPSTFNLPPSTFNLQPSTSTFNLPANARCGHRLGSARACRACRGRRALAADQRLPSSPLLGPRESCRLPRRATCQAGHPTAH